MKVISWKTISNGLWGKALAIGAVLYENGVEVQSFYARRPLKEKIESSIENDVLPQLKGMPITHSTYMGMLSSFAEFLFENKKEADIVLNMAIPVEARIIIDLYDLGFIDDEDEVEFSCFDISGCLKQESFDSAEAYNAAHGITMPQSELGTSRNPIYNSRATALCYMNLMAKH